MPTMNRLSIVVPVFNEAGILPELCTHLSGYEHQGVEVVMVDGGSDDATVSLATRAGIKTIVSARGRAVQMNTGAAVATGDVLLFLHADTRLPANAPEAISAGLSHKYGWGRFDVAIEGSHGMFLIIARMINLRSRLTGIATGDQAIFITREAFERVGGFPEQPLMEDIEMSRRLHGLSPPLCLSQKVTTSGRRWQKHGIWRTIFLMWRLRWAYWRGTPAIELARLYR